MELFSIRIQRTFQLVSTVLGLLGIEAVRLECRLYPRKDLCELPVLYSDA